MSTRTSRAVKGTVTSFVQYGLQIALQALLAPLILRVAGQETLGAYAVLMQAVGYLALVDLGFSVALNRYLAQTFSLDDTHFTKVLTTGRTFYLGSNTTFAVLAIGLAAVVGPLFSLTSELERQAQIGLLILAGWAVIRTPWIVYGAGLIATQNLAAANIISITGNVCRLVFSLGFTTLGGGLLGLMVANVLAEAVMVAAQWRHFQRLYPAIQPKFGIPDRALFVSMLKFGSQVLLINIAVKLVLQTDNLVVGYLYGTAAVSIYYITQMPGTLAYQLVLRLTDNATPAIYELYAQELNEALKTSYIRLHRYTWILIVPVTLGIVFFSEPLIALWVGPSQYAGLSMALALAIFAMQLTVAHVSNAFVMAKGQIRTLSLLALTEGVVNLVLSIILGRIWGLPGVMWATTIANIPTSFYLIWEGHRMNKMGWREYMNTVLRPNVFTLISLVAAVFFCLKVIGVNSWMQLTLTILIVGAVYSLVVYHVALMDSERSWFVRLAKLRFNPH